MGGAGDMNRFDGAILEFFNRFSQKSGMFDQAIYLLSDTDLLKGGVVVAILWALWFTRADEETVAKTRKTVIATFAGTFLALAIGIVLENALPFRFRPIHQPGLHFLPPIGITTDILEGWSSFPSDHATLFGGLVTGIFLASRRLGFLSIIYVLPVVLIPRIYLGFHYPTDILGGILLGCGCVLLANGSKLKKRIADPVYGWSEKYPVLFYCGFFLVSYQTVDLFDDIRDLASFLLDVAVAVVHRIS
jgi:membrane-associated phospholipid phosphatase